MFQLCPRHILDVLLLQGMPHGAAEFTLQNFMLSPPLGILFRHNLELEQGHAEHHQKLSLSFMLINMHKTLRHSAFRGHVHDVGKIFGIISFNSFIITFFKSCICSSCSFSLLSNSSSRVFLSSFNSNLACASSSCRLSFWFFWKMQLDNQWARI